MTVNKYINHQNPNLDQSLQEDLIIEAIKMNGFDIFYVPRDGNADASLDKIYGEILSIIKV